MLLFLKAVVAGLVAITSIGVAAESPVRFERVILTEQYFSDGIHCGDINRDGRTDIVSGPFWYEGPAFDLRHEFYPAVPHEPAKSPTDSLFSCLYDFNGDGWLDILVVGRVHLHPACWYENPAGSQGLWKKHYAFERIQGETPPWADLNQDGRPELICHWENRWGYVQPDWSRPTQPWSFHPITAEGNFDRFYHGTGVGDINSDGRRDLILNDGWWEQPLVGSGTDEWTHHPFRFAKKGGAQMYAYDVDGDGDSDVVTALDAHGWGLAWFEQVSEDGKVTFVEHTIMGDRQSESRYGVAFSQPHAIDVGDINADGLTDIIVGKRRWAHGPDRDIEPGAAPVIYWFELIRTKEGVRFCPHLIDDESGVGLQVVAADVTGNGAVDVLAASKLGAFLFVNRGNTKQSHMSQATQSRTKMEILGNPERCLGSIFGAVMPFDCNARGRSVAAKDCIFPKLRPSLTTRFRRGRETPRPGGNGCVIGRYSEARSPTTDAGIGVSIDATMRQPAEKWTSPRQPVRTDPGEMSGTARQNESGKDDVPSSRSTYSGGREETRN